MADNIKIIGNILNTTTVNRYNINDEKLISSKILKNFFGGKNDYIELFIYDIDGNLLNVNYNYLDFKLPSNNNLKPGVNNDINNDNQIPKENIGVDSILSNPTSSLYPVIEINPIDDLQKLGYSSGEFKIKYNFFENKLTNNKDKSLFIKEISSDRTEIRLASTSLSNDEIENYVNNFINSINNSDYYIDNLLNFGNDKQYVVINVFLDKKKNGYEILFKLYQSLPLEIQEKETLWIVEEKVNPYIFDINLDKFILPNPSLKLRSPNFDIEIPNKGTISTQYNNYDNLINNLQLLQSSSYNQITNLLVSQSVSINVDYTNFENFVFFGSSYKRLSNFYTKVKQIEQYTNYINQYTNYINTTSSLKNVINKYSASINETISQFDGYEYFLYFNSSSYAWPKSGSLKPYNLLSTGSSTVLNWYNNLTSSAQTYDLNNYNNLEFSIPSFIKDDENNQPFLCFLNMVGHYFDNIWIYFKAITDINLANNNLNIGISKDLVYQQLRSLGVKLYNNQAGENINQFLIGANTGSYFYSGSLSDFSSTSSYLNNIPYKDLLSEIYKRIYHNLPLLLKTKGTVAGLEYLISVFGIPSKTYITGSTISSSILNVKEFGGFYKNELLKGYNNNKVKIINNNITGNVLHPLINLQTYYTSSLYFKNKDNQYVDISFSPQNQINTYISGAISSSNSSWVLDDYIGDPRQIYSSSYNDLDTQRKLYYSTGVSGYPAFTSSLLDYNGFIKLIQYFDNALFKMLSDFVPERTSLSTGITIQSPVLERNKIVSLIPNSNTESIHNVTYSICNINGQYGTLYDNLSGDKKTFFNGELSGSNVNVNQYFEDNYNNYLQDWNVYNSQHNISESININKFLHSDWNVLLNNVSQSVTSSIRKKIEYIFGTTGSIINSAELQDSYLTLKSYNNSRYEGSKVTSLYYNIYSTSSVNYEGDKSFGKTAALDHNSLKIGWVKNIPSQSLNFYDKTSINLKYLVDKENSLTELSFGNFNLFEVQNTFKSGTPVILSLSDVQKPSNQVNLDGMKTIFKGGFSYDPIIFREINETLYFSHDNYISSSLGHLGVRAYCDDNYRYYSAAQFSSQPTIEAPPSNPAINGDSNGSIGQYTYEINGIDGNTTLGKRMSYYYNNESSWRYINGSNLVNLQYPLSPIRLNGKAAYSFNLLNFSNTSSGYNNEPSPTYVPINNGNYLYKVPRTSTYIISGSIPFSFYGNDQGLSGQVGFKTVGIIEKCPVGFNINDENSWVFVGATRLSSVSNVPGVGYDSNYNTIIYDDNPADWALFYNKVETSVSLTAGEYIRFQFYLLDLSNLFGNGATGTKIFDFYINGAPPNKQINKGYFEIYDQNTSITLYNYTSSYGQVSPLFVTSSTIPNAIIFSPSASYLFTTSSTFIPQLPASNYYSPVVDYFGIQKYDLIRIGNFTSPNQVYYEVRNVGISGSQKYAVLDRSIDSSSFNNAISFAILRPKPNETSVIINYKKQLGEVSQTILIPYDANDTIKNSVGNIFKNLNTSL